MAEEYVISVVIEGSDKASGPLEKVEKSTSGLNASLINSMVALEGMASGLNQLVGGANKMVGALERTEGKIFGIQIASEAEIETLRKWSATLEFIIGPMEMMIALMKIKTVMASADTKATTKQTGATVRYTFAQRAANLALKAFPLIALITVMITVIAILIKMEERTGFVRKQIDKFGDGVHHLIDGFNSLTDAVANFLTSADRMTSALDNVPVIGRFVD
tara:strand:- start:3861 stop:4520 length:660 start_codon:yes stop_codon:yes gene_type:complete